MVATPFIQPAAEFSAATAGDAEFLRALLKGCETSS